MIFVYHYVIIPFNPQYLPKHAPLILQSGGIQSGRIGWLRTPKFTLLTEILMTAGLDEIEKGETFEIVFTKEQQKSDQREEDRNVIKEFMVVIRVSDEIRKVIKNNNNKVFLGFTAHHVRDRLYVKCCKCHRYGHYHADCKTSASCGYCWFPDHQS